MIETEMMFNNETLLNSIIDKYVNKPSDGFTNDTLTDLGYLASDSGPTVCSSDAVKAVTVPDHLEMMTEVPKEGLMVGSMIEFKCAEFDQVFDPALLDNLDPDGNGMFGLMCLPDGSFGAGQLPSASHWIK